MEFVRLEADAPPAITRELCQLHLKRERAPMPRQHTVSRNKQLLHRNVQRFRGGLEKKVSRTAGLESRVRGEATSVVVRALRISPRKLKIARSPSATTSVLGPWISGSYFRLIDLCITQL